MNVDKRANTDRVVELDIMRFIAALSVVIYHWIGPEWGLGAYHITQLGFLGVELFFLISGFVILWTATNKSGYEFVASRISRLYPSFWICLALAIALTGWSSYTPQQILSNATMIPGQLGQPMVDEVYWTLLIEIKFYAVIFLLLVTKQIRHIERWLAGWLALSLLAAAFPGDTEWLNTLTFGGLSTFFVGGCFLYLIRSRGLTPWRGLALGVSLAIGVHFVITHIDGNVRQPVEHVAYVLTGVIVLQYLVFLLVALRMTNLPKSKLWTTLGAMTYPIYLLHYQAAGKFRDLFFADMPAGPQLAATLFVTMATALILALTIERRGCIAVNRWLLALGRKLRLVSSNYVLPSKEKTPVT